MLVYETFVLMLCTTTLVLTSSASKTEQTDGFSKDSHKIVSDQNVHVTGRSYFTSSSPSTTITNLKIKSVPLIMGEGGPIYPADNQDSSVYISKTASEIVTATKSTEQTSSESSSNESKSKLPKTRNASVVARKGAIPISKITARKGVGLEPPVSPESSSEGMDEAISEVASRAKMTKIKKIEPIASKTADETKTLSTKNKSINAINVDSLANSTKTTVGNVSRTGNKITTSPAIKIVSTIATKIAETSSTSPSPPTKRFRPKPTVTIGESDIDKPIPASPTKTPPLGMPRKIDYIVPVIITIMALPLLGGAAFFIYRRGRDCWDKRHYRRMDFLIDGMYNDHSWK